jgi:hypothetical protein
MSFVSASRPPLAADLRSYGENAVAERVANLDDAAMRALGEQAARYMTKGARNLAQALALAAVEVVEGSPRPLKRKRRIFERP